MDLVLKKFTCDDFADYFRLVNNLEVMAMITERPIPEAEARCDFNTLLADNDYLPELGHFKILAGGHQQFVGLAKLVADPQQPQSAELGYMLLPEYWGQGIGSRVATLLTERGEQQPKVNNLLAIIDPANLASRKILINHGFISQGHQDFAGLPGEVLTRGC